MVDSDALLLQTFQRNEAVSLRQSGIENDHVGLFLQSYGLCREPSHAHPVS
jgi:hypothetical protein